MATASLPDYAVLTKGSLCHRIVTNCLSHKYYSICRLTYLSRFLSCFKMIRIYRGLCIYIPHEIPLSLAQWCIYRSSLPVYQRGHQQGVEIIYIKRRNITQVWHVNTFKSACYKLETQGILFNKSSVNIKYTCSIFYVILTPETFKKSMCERVKQVFFYSCV